MLLSFQLSGSKRTLSACIAVQRPKRRFPWRRRFFGLTSDYMLHVHEQIFYLVQHGNWNYFDVYDLPITIRRWFVDRLSKYFEERNKEAEKSMK